MSARLRFAARRVFIDSAAYLALIAPREATHAAAVAIARRIATERWQSFTSNFVVAEAHALVLARRGRADAARLLRELDASTDTRVVRIEEDDERRAREIVFRYADKDFTLTDATSFAVMERLRIDHAFTFDRHFLQYGFAVLGADANR